MKGWKWNLKQMISAKKKILKIFLSFTKFICELVIFVLICSKLIHSDFESTALTDFPLFYFCTFFILLRECKESCHSINAKICLTLHNVEPLFLPQLLYSPCSASVKMACWLIIYLSSTEKRSMLETLFLICIWSPKKNNFFWSLTVTFLIMLISV